MLFLRPGEKDEVKPSVEVASKITDALELSLDFLVGKMNVEIERRSLKRLQDIQKLNKQDKGAQVVQEISSQ
ncbi:MAG: hypothetical protein ABI760_00850 [Ferruginibacter sp.]